MAASSCHWVKIKEISKTSGENATKTTNGYPKIRVSDSKMIKLKITEASHLIRSACAVCVLCIICFCVRNKEALFWPVIYHAAVKFLQSINTISHFSWKCFHGHKKQWLVLYISITTLHPGGKNMHTQWNLNIQGWLFTVWGQVAAEYRHVSMSI